MSEKMQLEEINYQHPPNNETALHVATRKQHKEMIEILLQYYKIVYILYFFARLIARRVNANTIYDFLIIGTDA